MPAHAGAHRWITEFLIRVSAIVHAGEPAIHAEAQVRVNRFGRIGTARFAAFYSLFATCCSRKREFQQFSSQDMFLTKHQGYTGVRSETREIVPGFRCAQSGLRASAGTRHGPKLSHER